MECLFPGPDAWEDCRLQPDIDDSSHQPNAPGGRVASVTYLPSSLVLEVAPSTLGNVSTLSSAKLYRSRRRWRRPLPIAFLWDEVADRCRRQRRAAAR